MITSIAQHLADMAGAVVSQKKKTPRRRFMTFAQGAPAAAVSYQPFFTGGAGNFPYYYLDPGTLEFNSLTYNWINTSLRNNVAPIVQGSTYFTNLFISALGAISYSLSSADLASLNTARQNALTQQLALLLAWKGVYGSIPAKSGNMEPVDIIMSTICATWANPATNLQALQSAKNINAILNNVPAGAKNVITPLVNYLNALQSVIPIINASSMNYGYLNQALQALQKPSASNGGITANNQVTYPAYAISTPLQDIINGLNDTANTTVLNMTVTKTDNGQASVSLNGGTGTSVPIDDLFTIVLDNYSNYFADLVAMSNAPVQLKMTFTGLTTVSFGPVAFSMANGQNWYWMKPILDSITNGSNDVSGFKFAPVPGIDFSNKGSFGYVNTMIISNQPAIQIIATNVDSRQVQSLITGSSKIQLSFLKTHLGNATTDYNITLVPSVNNASNGSNMVVIESVQPATAAADGVNSLAWVHGVLTTFPAAQ